MLESEPFSREQQTLVILPDAVRVEPIDKRCWYVTLFDPRFATDVCTLITSSNFAGEKNSQTTFTLGQLVEWELATLRPSDRSSACSACSM